MRSFVSVIVPVYNVEQYIGNCLESIIRQSFDNIEIIVVDDGSTDRSGQICDAYAEKDSRIIVKHKENGGAADARNIGISFANGEYVVFVDADDYIHDDFISTVVTIAETKKADIVVTDFSLFKDEKECIAISLSDSELDDALVLSEKQLYDDEFVKRETVRFTVPWGKICKRKLYDGILYPKGKTNEDTHTTWKLMERANRVVYLKKPLYFWRENPNSVTRSEFKRSQLSGLEAFEEQFDYYVSVGKQRYVEIVFDQYLNWFFWCYNNMKHSKMDYKKELYPYYQYIRKCVKKIKPTKSLGGYKWIKYRYLAYYKIPKILRKRNESEND